MYNLFVCVFCMMDMYCACISSVCIMCMYYVCMCACKYLRAHSPIYRYIYTALTGRKQVHAHSHSHVREELAKANTGVCIHKRTVTCMDTAEVHILAPITHCATIHTLHKRISRRQYTLATCILCLACVCMYMCVWETYIRVYVCMCVCIYIYIIWSYLHVYMYDRYDLLCEWVYAITLYACIVCL